jgi:hypothetical protein
MSVHVAHQVQELVGTSALVIITARVDDVALRLGPMVKMGFVEGLDRPIPRHGQPRARSGGWRAVLGLASLLPAGEHRQGAGAAYLQGMPHPRSPLRGQSLPPWDCRDDRVGHLRTHVRKPTYWPAIARALTARRLAG